MKKNGFVLIETLIATTLIAVVFTVLYIEFGIINDNYKKTYNNNTVEKIYATNNIKNYLLANGYESLSQSDSFVDITDCNMFSSKTYCESLMSTLNVKKAIYFPPKYDAYNNIQVGTHEGISQSLIEFVDKAGFKYAMQNLDSLVVEYNDGQLAILSIAYQQGLI